MLRPGDPSAALCSIEVPRKRTVRPADRPASPLGSGDGRPGEGTGDCAGVDAVDRDDCHHRCSDTAGDVRLSPPTCSSPRSPGVAASVSSHRDPPRSVTPGAGAGAPLEAPRSASKIEVVRVCARPSPDGETTGAPAGGCAAGEYLPLLPRSTELREVPPRDSTDVLRVII